ncbi:MAG: xanthine dehydrogenase small subunit [Steroidobacteraceae bacterium]
MSLPSDPTTAATVSFLLDDAVVRLPAPPPTTTVLAYLREQRGLCGSKEGCAEGDCGACTVVLGELNPAGTAIEYRAINSCIRFLPTLDGKQLLTVESLQDPHTGAAHPVQQAMVECHASQCGFCTPGFVMSLFALYQSGGATSRDAVTDALAGNLCRCTGYRPIVDAGLRMGELPQPRHLGHGAADDPQLRASLQRLQRPPVQGGLRYSGFHAPRSVDELAAAFAANPQALLLAGGTDIGLWVTKQMRELPLLIHIGEVQELQQIRRDAGRLWFGAAVTLDRAWPVLLESFPALHEQAQRFASPPIRNSATLCGNLANGSPIGDSLPVMLALDAALELRNGAATRRLPLHEFYLGYQRKALAPGEFVAGVELPASFAGSRIASYKIAKRHDQDISALSATFRIELDADQRVREVRLAYGGLAATAKRAAAAEAALLGAIWNQATVELAKAALAQDFTPLSDMRASSAYRLQVAGNLLQRFYLEGLPPRAGSPVRLPAQALARSQA